MEHTIPAERVPREGAQPSLWKYRNHAQHLILQRKAAQNRTRRNHDPGQNRTNHLSQTFSSLRGRVGAKSRSAIFRG